jgi:DNA-binding MarR family transcriptional regulator
MATSRWMRRAYDVRLAEVGLNLSDASLMVYVHFRGPLTQTRLADGLGLQRAATGAMVDKLEARGLIERRPDPADRRVWLVATTAEGAPVVDDIIRIDKALRDELRAGMSESERAALAGALAKLQDNLCEVLRGNS